MQAKFRLKSVGRFLFVAATAGVCSIVQANPVLSTVATFTGTNGSAPLGPLLIDSSGNIYGTAGSGPNGSGIVFELSGSTLSTLFAFNGSNGSSPGGGVSMDVAGNLYGTTRTGGANADGTVFELTATTHALTTLVTFNGSNGASPLSPLLIDSAGDLYGNTQSGGANDFGTVFEIPSATSGNTQLTTLWSFSNSDVAMPQGVLTSDSFGNLYGTTKAGSSFNGSIYELSGGNRQTLTTLAIFNNGLGVPYTGVVRDAAGDLFGVTSLGGTSGDGTLFELPAGSNQLTTLVSFNSSAGNGPAFLTMDAAGNLFGCTAVGGAHNEGTVFELSGPSYQTFTILAAFNGGNGSLAMTNLVADSQGDLFGTTSGGGTSSDGTIFEITGSGFVVSVPEPGGMTFAILTFASLVLSRRRSRTQRHNDRPA